jgi:hypothetical protein
MDPLTSELPAPEAILFRPNKKRKIYRQRATSPSLQDVNPIPPKPTLVSPSIAPTPQTLDELVSSAADVEGVTVSMAEILRQRKQHRHRVGGVEFRAAPSAVTTRHENPETALVIREEDREVVVPEEGGVVRKFAKQTGLVGDVDKHM